MKKIFIILLFFVVGCSDYNDITTSMAEINRLEWENKMGGGTKGVSGNWIQIDLYLHPDFKKDYYYDPDRFLGSWKISDSYYNNIIVQVSKLRTGNTERLDDKKYLEYTQKGIDKYGENRILKELKNLYNSPKISSLETNLKINGKSFGRRVIYYKNPKKVDALEFYYFTLHDGVKFGISITFYDSTVSESINYANTIAGTIRFKRKNFD